MVKRDICGLPLKCNQLTSNNILKENWFSLSGNYQYFDNLEIIAHISSSGGRSSRPSFHFMLGFYLAWSFEDLMHAVITFMRLYVQLPCVSWRWNVSLCSPLPVALMVFLSDHSSTVVPQPRKEGMWYRCPVYGWTSYSLHLASYGSPC